MDQTQQSSLFELTDEQKNKLYIGPFKGDYRWLSNFWESTITIAGQEYPTVEHFYQASKTNDVDEAKRVLNLDTPGQAKKSRRLSDFKRRLGASENFCNASRYI